MFCCYIGSIQLFLQLYVWSYVIIGLGKLSPNAMTTYTGMLLPSLKYKGKSLWQLISRFLCLEGQQGNNLLVYFWVRFSLSVVSLSQRSKGNQHFSFKNFKNCIQGDHHQYFVYDIFESHFLCQLSLSLSQRPTWKHPFSFKYFKKKYG